MTVPPAAARVIAALSLPRKDPLSAQRADPLPLTSLPALPRDGSLLYRISRVDSSGRATSREISAALGWNPGDPLEVTVRSRTIIIWSSADGMARVPRKPGVLLPAAARHQCAIRAGDSVLLAAAPDYSLVIVHTMACLDDMLACYLAAPAESRP